MPLQWRNQFWQSLEEGAGKRSLECGTAQRRSPVSCLNTPVLQVSLSGTLLKTLPELVTPLNEPFIRSEHVTDAVSALRKVLILIRLWKQRRVTTSTHVNMRRVRPGLKKKKKKRKKERKKEKRKTDRKKEKRVPS